MLSNCGAGEDSWEEIKTVNPKGNQRWIFIGRIDDEAEAPILWPPDSKGWLIGKYPDAGNSWGQEEKGTTEDEMAGWHHWFNGHEFEQTQGDSEGQEAFYAAAQGIAKSQTQLSDQTTKNMIFYLWNSTHFCIQFLPQYTSKLI